jgi:hypothetical protein
MAHVRKFRKDRIWAKDVSGSTLLHRYLESNPHAYFAVTTSVCVNHMRLIATTTIF